MSVHVEVVDDYLRQLVEAVSIRSWDAAFIARQAVLDSYRALERELEEFRAQLGATQVLFDTYRDNAYEASMGEDL